ncbi:DUF6089 family protein [Chondrinema litorale]|uniref:DUF6089 family protein n=1 Tax=Chondrinema litorale TaxID=2994555 RepID=UPI00254338AF|nr:DUF6089 family protein [Chondrinema litorale]UZR92891.1 DUF6089 family protein [Chondrinema litorale]
MKNLRFAIALLLLFSVQWANAQRYNARKQYWSLGGSVSMLNYFGDITPSTGFASIDFKQSRVGIGFTAEKKVGSFISSRYGIMYGAISGDDYNNDFYDSEGGGTGRYTRNLHFRTRMVEVSGAVVIDLFRNNSYFYKRPKIPIPYFTIGVAATYFNPQAKTPYDLGGTWVNLRNLQTEGVNYSPIAISVPLGAGIRYKVSPNIDFSAEMVLRYAFTDYLDDVSATIPENTEGMSELALAMAYRGSEERAMMTEALREPGAIQTSKTAEQLAGKGRGGSATDMYLATTFKISYIIGTSRYTAKYRGR